MPVALAPQRAVGEGGAEAGVPKGSTPTTSRGARSRLAPSMTTARRQSERARLRPHTYSLGGCCRGCMRVAAHKPRPAKNIHKLGKYTTQTVRPFKGL